MYTGCKFCFFVFFYFWIILHFRMYLFFLLLFRSVSLFHWLSCLICCGYCCCISLTLLLLSSRETHVRVYRMNYFLLETMYIYSNIYAVSFACLGVCVCVCVCVPLVRVYVSVLAFVRFVFFFNCLLFSFNACLFIIIIILFFFFWFNQHLSLLFFPLLFLIFHLNGGTFDRVHRAARHR